MNLTSEQALDLYEQRHYISYRFLLHDLNNPFTHLLVTHQQAQLLSHQFVTLTEDKKINNSNYYYNHDNSTYTLKSPKGELVGLIHKSSTEGRELHEFLEFINFGQTSSVHQFYLGEIIENEKCFNLIIFIDLSAFTKIYETTHFLSKNMIKLIQRYALNQYKTHTLRDCSNETNYTNLSPDLQITPYDYQLQTLTWMQRIENTDYKFLVPTSKYFKLTTGAYIELVNKNTDSFMSQYVFENDYQSDEMIRCRGGILADLMGTGKTISCLIHIYHNRPILFPLLTTIIEREVYIPSKATLIICPPNMVNDWTVTQPRKCFGNQFGGLNIIKIASKSQMSKYTLDQLVNADLIVTTHEWLIDKQHIGTNFVKKERVNEFLANQKQNKLLYGDQYHLYKNWSLLFLKYHRIIYDEFHEIIDSVSSQNIMLYIIKNCLRSKNVWGVSGTPLLENEKIMSNLSNLLQIRNSQNQIYQMDLISQHEVFNRFIRRNEKECLPPIYYRKVSIKQTIQEKQLYDSSLSQPTDVLMQLCCYHNLHSLNPQSIDDVTKTQNELRLKQKLDLDDQIKDLVLNLYQIETILKSMNPKIKLISELYYLVDSKHPKHTHQLVQQIQTTPTLQLQVNSLKQYRKYEKQIEIKKDELAKLEQCLNYYNQTLKITLTNGQFVCPITGDVVGDGEVVLTKHGNLFSKSAIEMLFEYGDGKQITCPVSGYQLTRADISVVTNQKPTETLTTNEQMFGSKITSMITAINALKPTQKILIFAYWEKLINTICLALAHNNIGFVNIKGNLNVRDKKIHSFQTDPKTRVMVLSAEFGATGLTLVEADNVFIVHPFLGADGQQIQKQAIKRAHRIGQTQDVIVSEFITENTIEDDIWKHNHKNDNLPISI